MFFTAAQFVAHLVGDYVLQSDYMATEKTKKSLAAFLHAFTYTLPFLFITRMPYALLMIMVTHFIIDRWRLARYVCWLKNWMQPKTILLKDGTMARNHPWSECSGTGYHKDRPAFMTVWLMIICDNTLHILCNALAIYLFG